MAEFVATFSRVHAHPIAAYDIKTAAAIAAALAKTHGWKVLTIMTRDEHYKQEK